MVSTPFRVLSVASGVGTCALAADGLGWEHVAFADIGRFPSAVLAHRFPEVPNLGDFTRIGADLAPVDLLCGGTPCQSFSVAGRRLGLADPRGNLALEYLALARRVQARWLVWENVPGVLSSGGGRDFGAFLGLVGECGYGWAYRVLDAQYAGVPQRRERVYVVGHSRDWAGPAAVLFEPESRRGRAPARGEAGAVAAALSANGAGVNGADDNDARGGRLVAHGLRAGGHDASEDGSGRGTPLVACIKGAAIGRKPEAGPQWSDYTCDGTEFTLNCVDRHAVAFNWQSGGDVRLRVADTTSGIGANQVPAALENGAVRRLTPRECERLQGLPDDWTLVPYRGKPAADGPRYHAIGNGWALPVVRWIFRRLAMVDAIQHESEAA